MTTNGHGWQSLEMMEHKSVLSHPGGLSYDCRAKVSNDGTKIRIYARLGEQVKAIFLDFEGNIVSEGTGLSVKAAAMAAGATGEL